MMMECPRCGFTQPKDQYCASCGLDVDHYVAKPKPFWIRTAQNPNFHLTLIIALIVLVVGYIFITQGERIGRNMGLIHGRPLSSREAGDPAAVVLGAAPVTAADKPEASEPEAVAAVEADVQQPVESSAVGEKSAPHFEVTAWEVPRDAMPGLLNEAQRLAEGSEGRAYIWTAASAKIGELVAGAGRRVGHSQTLTSSNGTQLSIETPQDASEAFQFGLYFQVSKADGALGLKWDSSMVLPSPGEASQPGPAIRTLAEATLSGQAPFTSDSTVMLVFDPANRTPREGQIRRAGPGPWTIFESPEFRNSMTDWVMLIQLK